MDILGAERNIDQSLHVPWVGKFCLTRPLPPALFGCLLRAFYLGLEGNQKDTAMVGVPDLDTYSFLL